MKKSKPKKRARKTVEVPDGEGWTRTVEVPAVLAHDHTNGAVNCPLCKAEKAAERQGGIPFDQWKRQLVEAMGHKTCWHDEHDEAWLRENGVDMKDATDYWSRNFTAEAYAKLRKLKAKPPKRESLIPDVKVETKLATLEVATRIDYWHEAIRTGKLDGEKIRDVGDLIHAIHQECEEWIEQLEDR